MDATYLLNMWIKNFFINIIAYLILLKIINYKERNVKNMLFMLITSFINSAIYILLKQYISQIINSFMMYFLFAIVISKIIKEKFFYSIIITSISLSITNLLNIICILVSGAILKILNPDIQSSNTLILMFSILLEIILLYKFFNIKRFKNGFYFLQNKEKVDNVGFIGTILIGIAIFIYYMIGMYNNYTLNTFLFLGIIIEFICMTVWLRRKITKFYKQKLKEQTVEDLTNEIKEKDELIIKISEENKALATINHKYSSRIRSLENFTSKIAIKPELVEKFNTEFGVDFSAINEQISNLSKEYSEEINKTIKINNKLPKTEIFGIDNLLEYLSSEAIKSDIKFNLNINGNISEMIKDIIPQNKLETLLGDHIKDAIIAINFSEGTNKEILLEIGKNEICLYDTGIEFEIDTLLKLGLEQVTTHKLTGGSGIGFMTTFETLKECKASLEIEELKDNKYTKAVKVIFDGLNEYRIKSYRAEEIKKQNIDERIKIE